MILTHADLAALTGYRQRARQIDWLNRQGIRYALGADGHPRTTLGLVEQALGGRPEPEPEPDWSAIRGPTTKNRPRPAGPRI